MSAWRFYLGAAILGAGLALKLGAPLGPAAAGVLAAGLFNWHRVRRVGSRATGRPSPDSTGPRLIRA
jgi:hypothetical protein